MNIILSALVSNLFEGYKEAVSDFSQGADPSVVNSTIVSYKDLVNRNQVTGDERNIDWWRKRGWDKFKSFVDVKSTQSSTTQIKRNKNPGQSIVLKETNKWLIVIPVDKAASCFHGKNTDWCVAKPHDGYFERYMFADGKTLVFYLELGTANKYCTTIDPNNNIEYVTPDNVNVALEEWSALTGINPTLYIKQATQIASIDPRITAAKAKWRKAYDYIMMNLVSRAALDKSIEDRDKMEQALKLTCNSYHFFVYCKKIGERWKYAEPFIFRSKYAIRYSVEVVGGRMEELENYILSQVRGDPTNLDKCFDYATKHKWRWIKLENYITNHFNQVEPKLFGYVVAEYIYKTIPIGSYIPGVMAIKAVRLRPTIVNDYTTDVDSLVRMLALSKDIAVGYTGDDQYIINQVIELNPEASVWFKRVNHLLDYATNLIKSKELPSKFSDVPLSIYESIVNCSYSDQLQLANMGSVLVGFVRKPSIEIQVTFFKSPASESVKQHVFNMFKNDAKLSTDVYYNMHQKLLESNLVKLQAMSAKVGSTLYDVIQSTKPEFPALIAFYNYASTYKQTLSNPEVIQFVKAVEQALVRLKQ